MSAPQRRAWPLLLAVLGVSVAALTYLSGAFFRIDRSARVVPQGGSVTEERRHAFAPGQAETPRVVEAVSGSLSVDAGRAALKVVCLGNRSGAWQCVTASAPPAPFHFEPLDPGEYAVLATSQSGLSKAERCLLGPSEHKQLTLDFGDVKPGLSLQGRVLDASGGAIASARVLASRLGGDALAAALTRADGAFELVVPEGVVSVRVDASAEGYSAASREVEVPADHLELALTLASGVFGRVVSGGRPQADAEVRIYTGGAYKLAPHTRTQPDGTFEFAGLEPGRYRLEAAFGSLRAPAQNVPLAPGERSGPLEIELEPTAKVSGRLTVDGRACSSGVVNVGDVPDGRVNTSERGEFTLAALPLGNHGVALQCAGAKPELKVLALTEAGEHSVQWDLQGGARLRVALVDGAGQAVRDMGVRVSDSAPLGTAPQGPSMRECEEQEPGRFSCDGLALGEHTVRAVDAEGRLSRETAAAVLSQASEVKDVTLALAGTTRIVVNVPREAADLSGVRVCAEQDGSLVGTARRLSPTSFVFPRMSAGEYAIYAGSAEHKSSEVVRVSVGSRAEQQVELPGLRPGTLRGRIVDEQGNPVVDAWVAPRRQDSMFANQAGDPAPVMTNVDGWFEVTRVAPGAYQAEVKSALGTLSIDELVTDRPGTFVLAPARGEAP